MNPGTQRIRILIVDDEPPARELVAALLRDEPDAEVVGECANGSEAVTAIQRLAPDLVFLDIQMPGLDGFAVLSKLSSTQLPMIVFVTAYNQHAIRAFEAHALDYILKPFEYERFHEAFRRARKQLELQTNAAQQERLLALIEDLERQTWDRGWNRIALREQGRVTFLKPEEIDWVESEGNYMRLHTGKRSYLLRDTMSSLETRLAAKKFLRISRTTLVNLERVKEWQPMFHGDSVVILQDGVRLTVSRTFRDGLERVVARLP